MIRPWLRKFFFIWLSVLGGTAPVWAAAPQKLTIWTSAESVQWAIKRLAVKFEKDFSAKVEINVLNKDLVGQFKTAALAGKGPDILVWAHDVVGELASSGLIEKVRFNTDFKKNVLPVAAQAFTYRGEIYGHPYAVESIALIYNKNLVKTPPKTFEELVKLASSLNRPAQGQFGFLYDIGTLYFSFGLLSAGGGYIFADQNGTLNTDSVGVANRGAIQGLEFIVSLVKKNICPASTDYNVAMNKMLEGKLAMTINGPWLQTELKKKNIPYGVIPLPTLNGRTPRPFVGAHGFLIRRSSPRKELAQEFIENYLVTKEGILQLYQADPRGPARQDVLAEIKDEHLPQFMASAQFGMPMPNIPEMGIVWTAMGSALSVAINGKTSPTKALQAAYQQITQTIGDQKPLILPGGRIHKNRKATPVPEAIELVRTTPVAETNTDQKITLTPAVTATSENDAAALAQTTPETATPPSDTSLAPSPVAAATVTPVPPAPEKKPSWAKRLFQKIFGRKK